MSWQNPPASHFKTREAHGCGFQPVLSGWRPFPSIFRPKVALYEVRDLLSLRGSPARVRSVPKRAVRPKPALAGVAWNQ
jgi:hypothetical protein